MNRHQLIIEMTPRGEVVIDVGCDHGHHTRAIGAIGTEREPNRLPARTDIPLVVADGLAPFRRVDVAVITGMGAHTILRVLREGPTPKEAIVHAPEYSDRLRRGLASQGWRIINERLAPEANRFAEVIHIERGEELTCGYELEFGPMLPKDPLHLDHANQLLGHKLTVINKAPEGTRAHTEASGWIEWLRVYISKHSPTLSAT